jgi:hypothetical protein
VRIPTTRTSLASVAAGYDRAFIPFPSLKIDEKKLPTNPSLPDVMIAGGGSLMTEGSAPFPLALI